MNYELTPEELDRYTWQMWTPDFGEAGQRKLRAASVLISRCGGVGGAVATYLAAAGIGRLVIAHGGELRRNDLNRQTLLRTQDIGRPRIEGIRRTLAALNPHVQVDVHSANMTEDLAETVIPTVDAVVGCAPLFPERYAMNDAAMRHGKPYLDAAMYDMEIHLMLARPGRDACLRCIYPDAPPTWTREFPVFGSVAATVGCMAATEMVKHLSGVGDSLGGKQIVGNFRTLKFQTLRTFKRPECAVCGTIRC